MNLSRLSWVGRVSLRTRRGREKYCFLFILMSFFLVCMGMVFFLPDLRGKAGAGVVSGVYHKIPELFLAPHIPLPPPASLNGGKVDGAYEGDGVGPRPINPPPRRHILEDRDKLYAKIEEDLEQEQRRKGILEKPKVLDGSKSTTTTTTASPSSRDGVVKNVIHEPNVDVPSRPDNKPRAPPLRKRVPLTQGGEDVDPAVRAKRDFIKKMMKDSWDNYVKYAWGTNELKPISHSGHSASIFGPSKIGATIVDAVDTLYIMGLDEEYKAGRDWIEANLNFDDVKAEISVFETNIRFVGGLLSCYSMTGDVMFRDKAYKLAKKLLPAFDTPSGIPYSLINLHSGASKNYGWASSGSSILSEFGTLHLEFTYLSDVTGDPVFKEKVYKIRQTLKDLDKPKGLYGNYVHPRMAKFTQNHVSMGALGDSFYEYLLKSYIQTGDVEAREMYDAAIDAFEKNGLIRYSKGGLLFLAEMRYDRIESKMDHLACFAGGLLALGAHTDPMAGSNGPDSRITKHMKFAEGITNTCHESYIRTATRLGPESFRFSDAMEARSLKQNEKYYILRPEVIESYMVLWRLTGDPKYRDWGWDATEAIEANCKAGPNGGYSGIRNVYVKPSQQDDVQQSFFLAETLKYLYLLFSSKELMDFDYWVFNTEAHPLPIKGANPFYRETSSNRPF